MNDIKGDSSNVAPLRFVDLCPECGYSLAGSPLEGNCPECGRAFDQSVLILHGSAMGSAADISNVTSRKLWRMLLAPGFLLIACLFMALDNGKRTVQDCIVVFVCAFSIVVPLISRWSSSRPGLIVVYMSPWGCLQHSSVEAPAPSRVFIPSLLFLGLLSLFALAFVTPNEFETRVKQIAILSAAMVVCAYFILRALRMPEAPQVTRTPAQLLKARGHRWNGTERLSLEIISPGKMHLQIHSRDGKLRKEIVDAEVVCDQERRNQIRELIEQWISVASLSPSQPAKSS